MGRSTITVTRVLPGAQGPVERLWAAERTQAGASAEWAERALRDGVVRRAVEREQVRVYLAHDGQQPVGYACAVLSPLSGLGDPSDQGTVWVDQLYVLPSARRRGVGRALLARVSELAEVVGAAQVVSCVPAGAKDTHRWFARIGFGVQATTRLVPTGALSRRLGRDDEQGRGAAVARRRSSLRERARREAAHRVAGRPRAGG